MIAGKLHFPSYNIFRKQPVVLSQVFPGDGTVLHLRPFWMIGDLKLVYLWLMDASTRRNTGMHRDHPGLFSHYQQQIESDAAQALLIAAGDRELGQFSIIPAQQNQVREYALPQAFDCCIQYIIHPAVRQPALYAHGLYLLCRYFFEQGNTGHLFLFAQSGDSTINAAADEAGFDFAAGYHTGEGPKNLYVMTSAGFQKKRVIAEAWIN